VNEWIQIAVLVWCVFLFPAGGTDIPKIGGQKWLRRILMSIGLGVLAGLLTTWWQGVGYALTLFGVLSCPYGSKTPYWLKALVFTGYGATSLWFGYSWWLLITPILCLGLFFFSNLKLTAKSFPWKICEGAMGFLVAAAYIAAILNKWRSV